MPSAMLLLVGSCEAYTLLSTPRVVVPRASGMVMIDPKAPAFWPTGDGSNDWDFRHGSGGQAMGYSAGTMMRVQAPAPKQAPEQAPEQQVAEQQAPEPAPAPEAQAQPAAVNTSLNGEFLSGKVESTRGTNRKWLSAQHEFAHGTGRVDSVYYGNKKVTGGP